MSTENDRLLGKLESGIDTLAQGQSTMIQDLKDHRQEVAEMHLLSMTRITEVEGDIERVEAKLDGHADEDNKRFSSIKWGIGVMISLIVAVTAVLTAMAES